MPPSAPSTGLYLAIETIAGDAQLGRLKQALGSAPISALLISPAPGSAFDERTAKAMIELAQSKGVAAILAADVALARSIRADGVHIPWSEDVTDKYAEAREILGDRFIVGADAGRSRHDAMLIGEGNADYVAFGIPAHVEDRERARERRLDLVQWWAEIFEIPVVAFDVGEPSEAAALAAAGTDFIAVLLPKHLKPAEIPDWIAAFNQAIADPQPAV